MRSSSAPRLGLARSMRLRFGFARPSAQYEGFSRVRRPKGRDRLAESGVRRLMPPSKEGDGRLNFAGAGRPPPPGTDSFECGGLILSCGAFWRQHPHGRDGSFQL